MKEYSDLMAREYAIRNEQCEFIIKILTENEGRIIFTPDEEFEGDLGLHEIYPIISTLYGKHSNYNIAITDVHLNKSGDGFYVDGIDQETEEKKFQFPIYPEQYTDVLCFIGITLGLDE